MSANLLLTSKVQFCTVSIILYTQKGIKCERAHMPAGPALHFTGLYCIMLDTQLSGWYSQMQLCNIMLDFGWHQMLLFNLASSSQA